MVAPDSRRNWKGITYDWDYVMARPTEECPICLSERDVALLLASIEPAHWVTRWYSLIGTSIDADLIDEFVSGLEYKLMTFKCSEFNKVANNSQDAAILAQNTLWALAWATDPGNPQTIDTRCPPAGGTFNYGGTDKGNSDLCQAVAAWCEHKWQETLTLYQALEVGLTAAEIALSMLAGPLGALIGGAALIIGGITISQLQTAMQDTGAVKKVECDLLSALKGQVITQANFMNAVDGLSETGNALVLANVLKNEAGNAALLGGTQKLSNYQHFLALLGASTVLPDEYRDCPVCDHWCHFFDFTLSDGGWEQFFGQGALYVPGTGWSSITRSDGSKGLEIIRYFPAAEITEIDVVGVYTGVSAPGIYVGTNPGGWYWAENASEGEHTYFRMGLSLSGITSVLINAYAVAATNIVVKQVKLQGTGVNPFGTDNC